MAALTLGGCNGDDAVEIRKGIVDTDTLEAGVVVSIAGSLGTVSVPMSIPVPNVTDAAFEAELEAACSLVISSNVTGSTLDISVGELITGAPSAPGEYAWAINDARDSITMTFWNQSPSGLTLKTDRDYNVAMAIDNNEYIETLAAMQFTAQPTT